MFLLTCGLRCEVAFLNMMFRNAQDLAERVENHDGADRSADSPLTLSAREKTHRPTPTPSGTELETELARRQAVKLRQVRDNGVVDVRRRPCPRKHGAVFPC